MQKLVLVSALAFLLASNVVTAHGQSAVSTVSTTNSDARVEEILKKMTLEEKVDLIGGVDFFYIRGLERVGIPKMKMADGPLGVRNYGPSTTMTAGIGLAATWNQALAERVGTELGRDARARGVHFLLGPGVNIYRAPFNGRNFEYFGEDPYLASRLAVGYIKGVQSQGVSATIKHFMGNNSEFLRHDSDSVIDERTMREIYLPVFEAAVKEAHVGAIMDSYNLVNGSHATQNDFLNNQIAKKEWGFDGVMMSDWFATYDGVAAANGGMDLEMPSGAFMNRQTLLPAIQEGKVAVATLDDKVRRILRVAARFGWLDRDQTDSSIPLFNQQGRQTALAAARESIVLLKNDNNLLPLDKTKIKTVAIIGPDAYPAIPVGGGSARVEPFSAVSYLEGLSNSLGSSVRVLYARGIPTLSELAEATNFTTAADGTEKGLRAEYFKDAELQGAAAVTRTEPHVNFGPASRTTFPEQTNSSRWSGFFTPQNAGEHDVFVQSTGEDGGLYRLYVDDKLIFDNWKNSTAMVNYSSMSFDARPHKIVLEQKGRSQWLGGRIKLGFVKHGSYVTAETRKIAAQADAVIVAAGFDYESESEGGDRTFNLPPGQDELIGEVAAANKNTVVAITSGGSVEMSRWIDRVPALIEAWYPGQEGGTALADILFGQINPSGRLPVTFERKWEDNPVHNSYYTEAGTNRVNYQEGVFVGYRGYEKNNVKPLFPFGYGLSYTTFKYGNLSVKHLSDDKQNGVAAGGRRYEVSFDVKNTGTREGADVAQVYVGDAHSKTPRPAKELKGFAKVNLRPGETRRVSVMLDDRAFSYYDMNSKQWRAEPGEFQVLIARSSQQIELTGKLAF